MINMFAAGMLFTCGVLTASKKQWVNTATVVLTMALNTCAALYPEAIK